MNKYEKFIIDAKMAPKLTGLAKRYTEDEVADALMQNKGVLTAVCNQLDCSFSQLNVFMREHKMEKVLAEARKMLVSCAEESLLGCLQSKNEKVRLQAAEFVLKSQGKDEGWGQVPVVATEVKLPDGVELRQIFGMGNANTQLGLASENEGGSEDVIDV